MKLPAFLHGLHKDVKARCLRKAKALAKGATWDELATDWLETSEAPGLIVLEGPSPLMGGQPHFHPFALSRAMNDTFRLPTDEVAAKAFRSALGTTWGVLCFLGQDSYRHVNPPGAQLPFLEACVRHWAELDGEGARYSLGTPEGKRLWELPTMIHYVLGQRGLPGAGLMEKPMTAETLASLIEQVRQPRLPPLRREWTPDKPTASRAPPPKED